MDAASQKPAVLIVDDDPHIRESLSDNLEAAGYEATQASSGKEALEKSAARFFDVVIMDYNLADMTGIEVIQKLRLVSPESQILMLTAHASLDTAVMAIKESVADFLSKPVDMDRLKRAIAGAVEKLRLTQDNQRMTAQLKKSNQELSHLSGMKSKFMSMSSHDLSNALMALGANFELLSQSIKPDEEQKKRMAAMSSSMSQLSRLTADLVDWASIEQGKLRLEPEDFNLEDMLQELIAGPQARARARGVAVCLDIKGPLPSLKADRRRIAQVLGNLVENAVRHTPKGGSVVVSARKADSAVRVEVKDSGEGIGPSEVHKIFQSFYQSPGGAENGRMGLGLSIAKEIIEAHRGRIWVESAGAGHGAAFFFTLPLAP